MQPEQTADTIYHGGTVITMVDDAPAVEAVAIADGRILVAGSEEAVLATRSDRTRVIDLAGRTLLPAFIDSHGHFMNAPQVVRWANCQGVPAGPIAKIADFWPVLEEHVARLGIQPGEWIVGYGYDRSSLEEARELTAAEIDEHFPDNPVMLIHSSNHGAVLNTKAFEWAGYDETTETPPGGLIVRKEGSNEPAGFIMETAFMPLFGNMPQPSEGELLDTLDEAQQIYASVGVTTVQEGALHAKDLRFLRKAASEGRFYLDVVGLPFMFEVPALIKEYFPSFGEDGVPDEAAESFGFYRDRLKLGGIKFTLDGSPQGKTAFWTEPLLTPGPAGEENHRGQPLLPPETINKALAEVYAKGLQIFIHCNGDAAIDMAIDGMRATGVTAADDRRTVIVHSQCMRPDQLDAYAELGFSPSFFTAHCFYWGDEHLANLGEKRASFLSPMRSAFARGLRCSNHTDFSVTPMEPLRVMWTSLVRTSKSGAVIGPDECVDRWQALKALTIDAAWQIREEDQKGTIEAGKLADLVVLDGNPLEVDIDAIPDIPVVETLKEGVRIFPRDVAA